MLKICEQKGVGDEYTVEQYYTLSLLAMDPVKQVRSRFIAKLHKGLARGIPLKCLPLDFMGFYAMIGMEADKGLKDVTKRYMVADITARKDCIKNLTYSSANVSSQLSTMMPDYMFVFAIAVLAHHPEFESTDDVEFLKRIRNALWFVLEPLMSRNDNFSFGFYKALVEKIKNHVDAMDDEYNEKLWAVCDLVTSLLYSKTTNFELKEFPSQLNISSLYFKTHPDGEDFNNWHLYVPPEMVYQPPKKSGKSVLPSATRKAPAPQTAKATEAEEEEQEAEESANSAEEPEADEPEPVTKNTRKRGRAAAEEAKEDSEASKAKKSAVEVSKNGSEEAVASTSANTRPKRSTRK